MKNELPKTLTPCERTLRFVHGEPVDHPPFHPIIMRWAARYGGVKYRDFCLDYRAKCAGSPISVLMAATTSDLATISSYFREQVWKGTVLEAFR